MGAHIARGGWRGLLAHVAIRIEHRPSLPVELGSHGRLQLRRLRRHRSRRLPGDRRTVCPILERSIPMRTRTSLLAGAALLVAAAAQPVSAQASPDSRWQAFLGCWAPIVQDDGQSAAQHTVCFQPAAGGVDVLTVVAGEITGRQHLAPDAGSRAVKDEQCEGTETATWSKDGARVYLRSTLQCGEDVLGRDGAGAFALAGPSTLMEVEAVGVNDQYGVRVQHYYALGAGAYPASLRDLATMGSASARLYASAPLTMPDIVDASTVLPPQ